MGVDRKQRNHDTHAGYGSKYRKEQGAEYFFVQLLQVGVFRYSLLVKE
jgi:hypothetical protein